MPSSLLMRAALKSTAMPTWACRRSRSCGTGRCARGHGGHSPSCLGWGWDPRDGPGVPAEVTGLGAAVLNLAPRGWDMGPPDGLRTWFSCPEGTLSPAAAM